MLSEKRKSTSDWKTEIRSKLGNKTEIKRTKRNGNLTFVDGSDGSHRSSNASPNSLDKKNSSKSP